ncbi:MAG: peptidylprolyl isomerase [Candidatus Sumerlaeia bacterium]|nr:peptidylprolyl isomerase [Candidatus Sumerlaeia bacterium]
MTAAAEPAPPAWLRSAEWTEVLGYDNLEPAELAMRFEQDRALLARIVGQAELDTATREQIAQRIDARRDELQLRAAVAIIDQACPFEPELLDDEIARQRLAEGSPRRLDIWYLFVADPNEADPDSPAGKRAHALADQLTPDNFAAIARLWSDAPSSARGGHMGVVDPTTLGPTFQDHLTLSPVGTISGPFRTRSGWNILWVRQEFPAVEPALDPAEMRAAACRALAVRLAVHVRTNSADNWSELVERALVVAAADIDAELAFLGNHLAAEAASIAHAATIEPDEADLRALYDAALPRRGPRRLAREILLTAPDWTTGADREDWEVRRRVRDEARSLRQRILDGELTFEQAAREHSAAITAAADGSLGWLQEPSSALYDTELGLLAPGALSPPIETGKGYLLLKLEAYEPSAPIAFEDCRADLLQRFRARAARKWREAQRTP